MSKSELYNPGYTAALWTSGSKCQYQYWTKWRKRILAFFEKWITLFFNWSIHWIQNGFRENIVESQNDTWTDKSWKCMYLTYLSHGPFRPVQVKNRKYAHMVAAELGHFHNVWERRQNHFGFCQNYSEIPSHWPSEASSFWTWKMAYLAWTHFVCTSCNLLRSTVCGKIYCWEILRIKEITIFNPEYFWHR